jgi:hypothetical protein
LVETVMIAMSCMSDDKRRRGGAPFAGTSVERRHGLPPQVRETARRLWTVSTTSRVSPPPPQVLGLRPGEHVRVRSASEIFATLDDRGTLDGLPFMPEMLKYCGRTLPVTQRADKTCAGDGVVRRMHNTVHLQNVRCDGSAHDGCQAACLMFWKEAWLERLENGSAPPPSGLGEAEQSYVDDTLRPATRQETEAGARYRCQATEIPSASERLRFREADQFVRDLQNWSVRKIVRGLIIELFNLWQKFSKRHLPKALLIAGGNRYPFIGGKLPKGKGNTPSAKLDLRPGDLVRIKSKADIVATLDTTDRNRGLSFDGEMSNYCGRMARVRGRVNRLIEESNGEMIDIKSDCVILEGVVCAGDYHRFCTRAIYAYWREIWLEKIDAPPDQKGCFPPCAAS